MKGRNVTSVWKYEFPITDHFSIPLPSGARVLTAQMQGDVPVMWVEVDEQAARTPRHFHVIGTGNPFPQFLALNYIATIQERRFVWHVYEQVEGK